MEIIDTNLRSRRRFKRRFARHAISYATVCSFLTLVNYLATPGHWWVVWIWAGWGVSVALQLLYYLADCQEENDND